MQHSSGTSLLSKFGNLSILEFLVVTSAYVLSPVRTDYGGGGGEFQGNPTVGRRMPFFEKEFPFKAKN